MQFIMPKPEKSISGKEAEKIILSGTPLNNVFVYDPIYISTTYYEFYDELTIENCIVEEIKCINIMFHKHVTIKNSHIKKASFLFSYFYGGLTIDNCRFEKYLDFTAGGHNQSDKLYLIQNSEFFEFVDFNDCWFTGNVAILNNSFLNGTNINSKKQYITLDGELLLENNIGVTDIDDDYQYR